LEQVKEECRDARGFRWLEDVARDLGFAVRTLRKTPGFSLTVIGTLALGIGANVAIFSVVNAVFLRPLKAPDADRIVRITESRQGIASPAAGLPEFVVWQEQTQIFEDVAAYRLDLANLTGTASPELLPVARVTS